MTPSSAPEPAVGTGAHPVGGDNYRRRRPAWLFWLLGLLALIVLAIILFAIFHHSGNSKSTAAPASSPTDTSTAISPTPAATTTASTRPSAGATASPGTGGGSGSGGSGSAGTAQRGQLLAGTASVLTRPSVQTLARYTGRSATANHVRVLSVPANEGFWIGSTTKNRVWVQLTGAGESGYTVHAGDLVSFTNGTVASNGPSYPSKVGVTEAEGADQLAAEGQHINVPQSSLHGVRG